MVIEVLLNACAIWHYHFRVWSGGPWASCGLVQSRLTKEVEGIAQAGGFLSLCVIFEHSDQYLFWLN